MAFHCVWLRPLLLKDETHWLAGEELLDGGSNIYRSISDLSGETQFVHISHHPQQLYLGVFARMFFWANPFQRIPPVAKIIKKPQQPFQRLWVSHISAICWIILLLLYSPQIVWVLGRKKKYMCLNEFKVWVRLPSLSLLCDKTANVETLKLNVCRFDFTELSRTTCSFWGRWLRRNVAQGGESKKKTTGRLVLQVETLEPTTASNEHERIVSHTSTSLSPGRCGYTYVV